MKRRIATCCLVAGFLMAPAEGAVRPVAARGLEALTHRHGDLDPSPVLIPGSAATAAARSGLARLGVAGSSALRDLTTDRWATLRPARPLIPGDGRANALAWRDLGRPAPHGDAELAAAAWERLSELLRRHQPELGLDPREMEPRFGVFEDGRLIQIDATRRVAGLPVRGARFTAVVRHGNLVLLGSERWADLASAPAPLLTADAARARARARLGPLLPEWTTEPALVWLPVRSGREPGPLGHRLAWALEARFAGDPGRWESLIDARSGELLAFQDLNHYAAARNVRGGVYPMSTDGVPPDGSLVAGYPMPYADLDVGGFTDAGGNFDAPGVVTTTLSGQFIHINDTCGAIAESGAGDIDLEGTDGDSDCDVPPGHSAGDTAAARTAFYELNRIREMAVSHLPANAWLASQLVANTNIDFTCGASWNGVTVNFFRHSGSPCENPAQLAGVVGHEWAHGLDDNDVQGTIPAEAQGGGEGFADLLAALRGNQACVGRGFFVAGNGCNGYGDPCTPQSGCTGVRSVDWADRQSGLPHTLTWVRANCPPNTPQCVGAAYAEALWDLAKRDLPAVYGMDDDTAREVTTRLTLLAGGNLSGWFTLAGPDPGDAACGATQAYLQFLAADDDDGDLDNGTPHMTAIAQAFDRHEIGCTPGGSVPGPTVQDSGCAGTPTAQPQVTGTATGTGADLAWTAVAGATEYRVFRTDGERLCGLGKALVAATAATTFADSGLQNGRPYSYVVIPMGPDATCFGPASDCVTVGDSAIFADGFESGDTTGWDSTVPP